MNRYKAHARVFGLTVGEEFASSEDAHFAPFVAAGYLEILDGDSGETVALSDVPDVPDDPEVLGTPVVESAPIEVTSVKPSKR